MKIGKPTPIQAEWLAKLGMSGLENFELPDAEVRRQWNIVLRQHGPLMASRQHGGAYDVYSSQLDIEARAIARVAAQHYGRNQLTLAIRSQLRPPIQSSATIVHKHDLTGKAKLYIVAILVLLAILLFAATHAHAQQNINNAGTPSRANIWVWNGTQYVPATASNPLSVNCANCTGSGVSATDNQAFTAGSTVFVPIGGVSGSPTNCSAGPNECTVLITATRHMWTTCDNCSSSSFADEAAFTAGTTNVGISACLFQSTPTNNPLANLQAGALQCTTNRELFVAYRTTPTVNAAQSGTWTVQPGNTANTTPWLVSLSGTNSNVGVTQVTSPWVVNLTQVNSNTVPTSYGASGAGTQRTITASATPKTQAALSTTVQTVVSAAGYLDSVVCNNGSGTTQNSATTYIQLFDTTGAVTLGSTAPTLSIPIPPSNPGGATGLHMNLANGLKVAATTTATGSTAPGTAVDCNFGVM